METKCQRPGCTGQIIDGYCDTCGKAPVAAASTTASKTSPASISSTVSKVASRATGVGSRGTALSSRTSSTHRSTRSTRTSSRRQLGAGMVAVPAMPSMDPLQSVMADPTVPENKRYCPNCNAKLSQERGYCPMCGTEYSFKPTLKAGDIVAKQYEVKGPMAFGGLGWIYLGWDTVLSRWVVMKGLLNSKDEISAANAVAERQFLAAVKHPNIVGIYNFVNEGSEGYIVMEYVGGKTLKTIRKERGPLPAAEAIAYIHRVLSAFSYLAQMGIVYCDFKPDNFMVENDDVKLIDMGGVRRIDDLDSDVYGTKGYSAPEGSEEPSFVSDLYTVARTLAVLIMDFSFQSKYEFTLPSQEEQPVLKQYDSLYRFLIKATHQNPDDRFQTADEMADQLLGVLREITSTDDTPHPADSLYFAGDNMPVSGIDMGWQNLPQLKVDTLDKAAGSIFNVAGFGLEAKIAALDKTMKQFPESAEAPFRLASAYIEAGLFDKAETLIKTVETQDAFDWRTHWYRGLKALAQSNPKQAIDSFDHVYSELPGELTPKLALAYAYECNNQQDKAVALYDRVSRTDPNYTSSAFGAARCRIKLGDRDSAVNALMRVPNGSIHYTQAQIAAAKALIGKEPQTPGAKEVLRASTTLENITVEGFEKHSLAAELFLTAISILGSIATDQRILGEQISEHSLRKAAERELRACAAFAKSIEEKFAFIDKANRERPVTVF